MKAVLNQVKVLAGVLEGKLLKELFELVLDYLSDNVLTVDNAKVLADKVLDFVEDKVLGSKSAFDDALILPICEKIREAFNIPDND